MPGNFQIKSAIAPSLPEPLANNLSV